ncbi:MAG: cytochrome c [Chloroflexota bacterium]
MGCGATPGHLAVTWQALFRGSLLAIALLGVTALTGCTGALPLTGEAGMPGYVLGPVPEQYRGMTNPFTPDDAAAVEAGKQIYAVQCLRCHGATGRGDGPQAPYMDPLPANFTAPLTLREFSEHQDYAFGVVSAGKVQSPMPAFQQTLGETERWQVITYAWYLGLQANE